jgi:hypothetical protein
MGKAVVNMCRVSQERVENGARWLKQMMVDGVL